VIQIAPFEPRFAEGVVAVILPIQQSEFGIPVSLEDQPDLRDIAAFYQKEKGKGNFWVALADGKVVGTVGLLDIGDNQAALRKMFVKGEYRGAMHAAAHRQLAMLLAWCQTRQVRAIYLGTTARFLAAHRFYEKNGFREIARASLPETFPVMTVDNRVYCRLMG